jgi:serine/threonine protein kinase
VGASMTGRRRFRIIEVLGRGGMGSVYRAEVRGPGGFRKEVALKFSKDGLESLERLRDEAQALASVRHRAVVQVDGLVQLGRKWALILEYVEGVRLDVLVASGSLPLRAAIEVGVELAGALEAARSAVDASGLHAPIIHRDLKPANVLVTPFGSVKLLDFGLAMPEEGVRRAGFGTIGYAAPERLRGVEGVAGDVFALGVVLVELFAGEAFGVTGPDRSGHDRRVQDLLRALARTEAGNLDGLADLVGRMLNFDPSARPDPHEVAATLSRLVVYVPGLGLREVGDLAVRDLVERERGRRALTDSSVELGSELVEVVEEAIGESAWTPPTPTAAGVLGASETPSDPPTSPLAMVRALLGPKEPDTLKGAPERSEGDTGSLVRQELKSQEDAPFRVLALLAGVGLLIAAGLLVFVFLQGGVFR